MIDALTPFTACLPAPPIARFALAMLKKKIVKKIVHSACVVYSTRAFNSIDTSTEFLEPSYRIVSGSAVHAFLTYLHPIIIVYPKEPTAPSTVRRCVYVYS